MDGFIGEIRLMAFNFTPIYWMPCIGTVLNINSYQPLYAVIGRSFTPGTVSNNAFSLPDLRGLTVPDVGVDPATGYNVAFAGTAGHASEALAAIQLPPHTHVAYGVGVPVASRVAGPTANYLSGGGVIKTAGGTETALSFIPEVPLGVNPVSMNAGTLSPFAGQGGPHENRQPFLSVQYFICTEGEFPLRN